MNPDQAASAALQEFDTNNDGKLSVEEVAACPGLGDALRDIDQNKDQFLTADEIAKRVRKYQDDKLGLIYFSAVMLLNGKPLENATVTFHPEKFLGTGPKAATGRTDAGGSFVVTTEGIDVPGAQCGIYRIVVSQKDAQGNETLPEKYSSAASTLGIEVTNGAPFTRDAPVFRLTSK